MNLFSIGQDVSKKQPKQSRPLIRAKVSSSGVVYGSSGNTASRTSFQKSEYNLGEVSKVIDVEAYVRQAFGKHVELCLKEGYQLSSRNEDATKYIKRRFREMAEVSNITLDMIIRSVTQNMVAYSNAFLVKVRDIRKSSGSPIPRIVGSPLQPVAAYFPIDPTSVQIKRDLHGKTLQYLQKIADNPQSPVFRPEDVVHFYYDRKEGLAFGTPYIIPTLDDIRSLRRMEENVEMLLSQHLFPLYQYIVGTEENPAELYDDGSTEVDIIKQEIENMPTEGSIVTPERHEIRNLGAEGKALDASKYLEYFEARVLAGLGISEMALGRGGTANRATAGTIDKMMQDRCKDFQDVIEGFVNEFMIKELLYEGGFSIDESEDNFVKLKFNEIDIDSMLKVENHSVFKYEHDAITETEMRELLGKDPIAENQREDMYLMRVDQPKVAVQADEDIRVSKATPKPAASGGAKISPVKKKATTNREKPANQYGSKPAKTKQKKDDLLKWAMDDIKNLVGDKSVSIKNKEILHENSDIVKKIENEILYHWNLTRADIMNYVKDSTDIVNFSSTNFDMILSLTREDILKKTSAYLIDAFDRGREDSGCDSDEVILAHEILFDKMKESVYDLLNDLSEVLIKNINNKTVCDAIPRATGVFDSLTYKINMISENIVKKSYYFGKTLSEGK